MQTRLDINTADPKALKAMYALETYLASSELSTTLKELIKIRSSQINNCAFCINMHTTDAIKNGETAQRIFLLSAWKEVADLYTEEEQVALTMTEEITLIANNGLSDATYQKACSLFSETQIAQIIMAIATINAWNRIAVSTHKPI
ncbi:carboxymuconolactone decarboxylase family protein [Sphingobacterium sp. LRF_L2]|uniref:carboxymuconolactone decarboxylase family protein n=1 Tax=Sphingobacterium sp. LRF_L2 TaxID=3369421 RepID=UPI003F601980